MNVELLTASLDEQLEAVEASSIDSIFEGLEAFDLDASKASSSLWGQASSSYQDALSKLVNEWFGSIGKTVARGLGAALNSKLGDFEKLMSSAYSKAFQAGALKMGNSQYKDIKNLTASDKRFIRQKISREMGYLKRYLSQDGVKKLAGKHFRGVGRAKGFVNSLDSAFFQGMLGGANDSQVFFWELGGAVVMHCPDCITLNVGSPYLKQNLPTVPRAGETQCHSWCKCTLRAEGLQAEYGTPFQGSGLPMDAQCGVWDAEGVPVSGSVQKLFDDLYRQLNLARGKIAAAAGEAQKRWVAARIQVNQDIIDLSKSYKVRVVPKWSVKDITTNIRTLTGKGLVHVTDLRSIPVGSNLYIVNGGSMRIITAEMQDGKLGFVIDGRFTAFESPDNLLMFGQGVK
jgi:hypothetical protein